MAKAIFELEFRNVGFSGVRETGVPGEKPSELGENQQKNSHMANWLEANPLNTEPSMLPVIFHIPLYILIHHNECFWSSKACFQSTFLDPQSFPCPLVLYPRSRFLCLGSTVLCPVLYMCLSSILPANPIIK